MPSQVGREEGKEGGGSGRIRTKRWFYSLTKSSYRENLQRHQVMIQFLTGLSTPHSTGHGKLINFHGGNALRGGAISSELPRRTCLPSDDARLLPAMIQLKDCVFRE